jgi:hypothetical protein
MYNELDFDDCTTTADECEGAMDDTELNRTRLVEKFVTHANFLAAVAAQFDDEWIADLIGEPVHSWAIDFVGIELGNLAS